MSSIDRVKGITYNDRMPAPSLDDPHLYARLDPEGLGSRIAALPDQMRQAWAAASAMEFPKEYHQAGRIVILGMGGSGIGGSLLKALAFDLRSEVPVHVVRGYRTPAWLDERSLVIASSNSGNTEEIVAAFDTALTAGARCIATSAGGRLLEMAAQHHVPALKVHWQHEPRAALGWSFIALLAICARLNKLPPGMQQMFDEAMESLEPYAASLGTTAPEADNAAKQLARRLDGRLPVIIGAESLAPVAYRWRTQFNENAKIWAIADELPEMNHNAPLGYGAPTELVPLLHVLLLRHDGMHPRIRLRIEATYDDLQGNGVAAEIVDVPGPSLLAQQLRAVQVGDFASYYLGILNGVNPSSMAALERLKKLLAAKEA